MWRFNNLHIQCPFCGAESTNYGGVFPYISPDKEEWTIPEYMKKIVLESDPDYIF